MTGILHTPTPDIKSSLEFYAKLGFEHCSDSPTMFTDGKVYMEINADRFARPGIKLFKNSWKDEATELKRFTNVIPTESGYLLSDPSGVWIYLFEQESPIRNTENEPANLENKGFSILGNYVGISLETMDMEKSDRIYQALGFHITEGSTESGFASYSRNGFVLTLMKPLSCPHLFFNPSMTFFNGKDNLSVIDKIRLLNIPITEEITYFNKEGIVDNILVRDPGGYGFFIFSD